MKNFLLILTIAALSLNGCAQSSEETSHVYDWKTQGITFNYPDGYNVLETSGGNVYITTATELPDGDISVFWTLVEIDSSTSLEERLTEYSQEDTFSQTKEVIGNNEFTKVNLYANFGGFDYSRYLLEIDGKLLDYKVGKDEGEMALEVLGSIQFVESNESTSTDDFKYDADNGDYYGNLIANGYVTLKERPEAFCVENCPIYTYAFFNVLDTDNEFFDDYIEEQKGNSFVGDMSIGLGCVDNAILWRWNDSDELGMQKYTNSSEVSEALLNSSAENPIKIELERYLFTSGSGAPDCYSHFAQVNIVE